MSAAPFPSVAFSPTLPADILLPGPQNASCWNLVGHEILTEGLRHYWLCRCPLAVVIRHAVALP